MFEVNIQPSMPAIPNRYMTNDKDRVMVGPGDNWDSYTPQVITGDFRFNPVHIFEGI